MKKFNHYLSFVAVFALLLTSCSKDDDMNVDNDPAKATLSFGAFLNDMTANRAALKQALENIPKCSDDAPAYVEVVLSQEGSPVVGTIGDPLRVTINPNPGDYDEDGVEEYFTNESSDLELDPGVYSLEYFTVLNANEDIIWVAPYDDGNPESFAAFVETSLPFEINLTAGSKQYVDVEVLCFDDRMVNEYGYLFFDLETSQALEFCFFANFCDEDGQHYPAHYSVDIWIGTDDTGRLIYSNKMNAVENEGDPSAAPLCLFLPDLSEYDDDEDYIYYEVTLLDWEGVYGDVEEGVITGRLSRNDIEANFDGSENVNYEHLRFGCDDDESGDDDGDGSGDGDNGDADDNGDDGDDGEDNGNGDDDDNGDEGDDEGDDYGDGDDNDNGDEGNEGDDDGDGDSDGNDDWNDGSGDAPNGDGDDDNGDGNEDGAGNQGCDGAFMFGDYELNEDFEGINSNRWGWANFVEGDGTYTRDLWAGAGQNNTSAGTLVGQVTYVVDGDDVQVTIDLADGNFLEETHIYLDGDEPAVNGLGQYGNTNEGIDENRIVYNLEVEDINEDGSFWIIVHAEVCGG